MCRHFFTDKYNQILIGFICLSVLFCIFFAYHKEGYYIDEYYTYTLANGSGLGIDVKWGHFNDSQRIMDELTASLNPDNLYGFSQAYTNNANDVHPFLYYYFIHLISLFFPHTFSKWIGLSYNIVLLIPCIILMSLLSLKLTHNDKKLSLLIVGFYAFSPATFSGSMLIRMYFQFSLFVLLYTYFIASNFHKTSLSFSFLIKIFFTGFLGFLTQYYFVIVMFFLTLFYCIYLMLNKRLKDSIIFGSTALLSLCATLLVWRVSIFHIFKGYRGKESFNNMLQISSMPRRLKFFFNILNTNLFGGLLPIIIIVFILFTILIIKKTSIKYLVSYYKSNITIIIISMLYITALAYFLVIAKIGLLASYASSRYLFPIYNIFIISFFITLFYFLNKFKITQKNCYKILLTTAVLILICGYYNKQVLYLYPEEKEINEFLVKNTDTPIISVQEDISPCDVRIKDWITHSQVYFCHADQLKNIIDSDFNSQNIILYLHNEEDYNTCLSNLKQAFKVNDIKLLYETSSYNIFILSINT